MKIEYLGHSCFKLTGSAGVSVVCDPYSHEIGYKMPAVEANIVTISHHHFDHDFVQGVKNNPTVIEGEGNFDICGVQIEGIGSFHDDAQGKKRGKNIIFKIEMDGITICHLGDLGEKTSESLIKKISPVDILLIPVGGNYTIDAKTAKQYVDEVKPKIVIPMHYRTADGNINVDGVDGFLKLFDGNRIYEENYLDLSVTDLKKDNTKIIVLRRAQ